MQNTNYVETPIAEHFDATDKHEFPDKFTWDFTSFGNIVPLASANPERNMLFRSLTVPNVANQIGYVSVSQINPFTTMRFEVEYCDNGLIDLTYTGFNLSPIEILANTGYSLEIALKYYQNKRKNIILYASKTGYYWFASKTTEISVF